MSDPPKQYRQNLLSGAPSVKGASACFYPNVTNDHQRFMNAFYQSSDITLTRQQCQQNGSLSWKQVEDDPALQQQFIAAPISTRMNLLKKAPVKRHRIVSFFTPGAPRFPETKEEPEREKKKSLIAEPPDILSANVRELFRLISFNPLLLIESQMLLKDDFAQPVEKFASKIVKESQTISLWQAKFTERSHTIALLLLLVPLKRNLTKLASVLLPLYNSCLSGLLKMGKNQQKKKHTHKVA